MHALIREYAEERAADAGERGELRVRHARVMREIAETLGGQILTAKGERALRSLDHEQHNLRAAVGVVARRRRPLNRAAVLGATWRWFQQRGRLREGRAWLADLLAPRGVEVDPRCASLPFRRTAGWPLDGGLRRCQGRL